MPRLDYAVSQAGLAVPVLIGLDGQATSNLVAAGQPVPRPILLRGLLDTGSSVTAVASWVLQQLGLPSVGAGSTQTAAGPAQVRLFEVSVGIIPDSPASGPSFTLSSVLVSELQAVLTDADVLIGLNVLLQCKLVLDGPTGQFALEL